MKYIFVLSGPNYDLAKEEVKALTVSKSYTINKNKLTIESKTLDTKFLSDRLAFTHEIHYKNIKKKLKKEYQKRKPHLRPQLHPSSLNPKLAKCLINLTGIKKGPILDPFCGSAGILIEAALMNLKPIGYDIDEVMLRRAIINLTHYQIKNFNLKLTDSTKINKKYNYIVTDLPYGKNTSVKDLNELYLNFLKNLKKILVKKAVIVFPHFINYKSLIKKAKLMIENEFSYYIHKSLTKKIVILKK